MAIINTIEHYNELLANGLSVRLTVADIKVLAQGFVSDGIAPDKTKDKIVAFCKKNCKQFNYAKWESKINSVVAEVMNEPKATQEKEVYFTACELGEIRRLDNPLLAKLAFVMLALAKRYGGNYLYLNTASTISVKELFEIAKVNVPQKKQNEYLRELYLAGIIDISLKPLLKCTIRICDKNASDKSVLSFVPNSEMVIEYERYYGAKITSCIICGKSVLKTNNKMKYCKNCARQQKRIQSIALEP